MEPQRPSGDRNEIIAVSVTSVGHTLKCSLGVKRPSHRNPMQGVQILKFWGKITLKNFKLCFWLNEECPKLLCGLDIGHSRRQTIPMWNSSGGFFRALSTNLSTMWWLVVFKLWAGVIYLSFSIDTAPQWILWKRSREDWSIRASKVWDGISRLNKHFADYGITISLGPAINELCCDLVNRVIWDGVRFLSLSIDTVPQLIMWKRSRQDICLRPGPQEMDIAASR